MNALSHTWVLGLIGGLLLAASHAHAETDASAAAAERPILLQPEHPLATQELRSTDNYTIVSAPTAPLHMDPPTLPDSRRSWART